jgi:hypothetical protein
MIQRIQSLYLFLSLVCLGFVAFGAKIVAYLSENSKFDVYAYGIARHNIETGFKEENLNYFPGYTVVIALMLIGIVTLISFKNLKRQLKFGRMYFYTYFALLISTMTLIYLGEGYMHAPILKRELGFGFLILVIGFPFTFLANTGIKRDKNLLDSLNRLR